MAELILVRHGQSTWNALDKWTGSTDVDLTERGKEEARNLANLLGDKHLDAVFTSSQQRAKKTWAIIAKELGLQGLPTEVSPALNERDYGELTGMKRTEVVKKFGHEQFMKWRRGWDAEVPGGENLQDVYNRVVPYYESRILPLLKSGKTVLTTASGNSFRALMKYLENISDKDITKVEMPFNEILIYEIDRQGNVLSKQKRMQPL